MAGVRLEWAQFGDFDSFDVIRSDTSLANVDDADLPSPIATNLKTMYYVDTAVVENSVYYYRVVAWRNGVAMISSEVRAEAKLPWTPDQITIRAWYDFSNELTVTIVDNAISNIHDKSGNGFNLSQSTASQRPSYSNTINSRKIATFDGINDALNASIALLNVAHSLFIVFKPTIESSTGSVFGQWAAGQTGRYVLSTNQNSNGATLQGRLNPFNSTATDGGDTYGYMDDFAITNEATIIESICTPGFKNWKFYKNGLLMDSATVTNLYTGVNSAIGSVSASQISNPYDGHVGEIIIVDSVVDTETRQKIEGYLAHKWGLTSNLPSDHPFKTNPPLV